MTHLSILTRTLLLLLAPLMWWSCSGEADTDKSVATIESMMAAGDFDGAQRLADKFVAENPCTDSLSIPQLCHMAIVMAQLDENGFSSGSNAATAVSLYRAAVERDSLALAEYFRTLSTDDYKYLFTLKELLRRITDREDGVIYSSDDAEAEACAAEAQEALIP